MFDRPVDITATYGATVFKRQEVAKREKKPLVVPQPVAAKEPSRSTATYREYREMRKTPEFWQWWKRQYAKQDAKCYYCLESLKTRRVNVEHIIPMSRGGQNTPVNMVLSCAQCNKDKGSKLIPKKKRNQLRRRLGKHVKQSVKAYKRDQDYQADLALWYRNNFD